jgi:hypothetical protein
VAIGHYPELSLQAASNERDKLAVLVSTGKSPAEHTKLARLAREHEETMAAFSERYFHEAVTKSRKDPRQIRRYLDNEILAVLGARKLGEVTASHVQVLVFRKRDNGQESAAAQIRSS